MPHLSRLALPGYAVCVWLIVFSAIDATLLALPLSPSIAEWRYSGAAHLARYMLTPALGVFMALALAVLFEHPRMLKFISVISGLATLGFAVVIVMYFVDSFPLRGVERQGLVPPFSGRWAVTLFKLIFAVLVAGVLTTSARALGKAGSEGGGAAAPGVVGR